MAACRSKSDHSGRPILRRSGGSTRPVLILNSPILSRKWPSTCAVPEHSPWSRKHLRTANLGLQPRPDHRVPNPSNLRDPNAAPVPGILGFIVAEVRRQNGHIITIDVVAAARRSGVGSALLRAAEERLRESGATTVALETAVNNAAAIRFYKQKGYFVERTARGYYSNHLDALVMAKSLATNYLTSGQGNAFAIRWN